MNGVDLADVPRPPSENDSSVALRLPDAWLKRADDLVEFLSRPGIAVTRSDVLRAALARGLEALEHDKSRSDASAPPKHSKRR